MKNHTKIISHTDPIWFQIKISIVSISENKNSEKLFEHRQTFTDL